jgi:predicted nucleic acid-binding protein
VSLDSIPSGARVLIDANILIYARLAMSAECRRLLGRCLSREIIGVVTSITLAEYCHRRMMQEAQLRGLSGANPARALAQNPGIVRALMDHRREVEDLLAGDMLIVSVESSDFAYALDLQRSHGLLTNDSLNLSCGLRVGTSDLATADRQFQAVPSIRVWTPGDLT